MRQRSRGEDRDPFTGLFDRAPRRLSQEAALFRRGEQGRGDRDHLGPAVGVHVMHRHDGAVFQPEACDPVRDDVQASLARLRRDGFGQFGVARQVVAQILDHVRGLVAGERPPMMRIGVDMVAEIGEPVRVEHDEGRDAAIPRAPAEFAQRAHGVFPRRFQRTARNLRQHQRRNVGDLGGKNELSHQEILLSQNTDDGMARNPDPIRSNRITLPASVRASSPHRCPAPVERRPARILPHHALDHDPIRSNRITISSLCLSMIFSEDRLLVFRIVL